MSDHEKPVLEPAIISVLEDALEERKTRKDRRQRDEVDPEWADPAKDRRSGVDRRNPDD